MSGDMRILAKLNVNIREKLTYDLVDHAVPEDQRVEMKESEKIENYLDLAGELKK